MKRIVPILMAICFFTAAAGAGDALYFNQGAAPAIDGIEDAAWKEVEPLELQRYIPGAVNTVNTVNMKTTAKVMYDRANIYFFFHCRETNLVEALQQERLTRRDAAVWQNDCVEVLIDAKGNNQSYYQFVVDIHNGAADFRRYDPDWKQAALAWNGVWRHATGTYDDGWTAEVAIPWNTLEGNIYDSKTVRLNLSRMRTIAPYERTVLAQNLERKGFHQPECFQVYADLRIDRPVLLAAIETDALYRGMNQVQVKLRNPGAGEINGELTVALLANAGGAVDARHAAIALAAGGENDVTLPCEIAEAGDYQLAVSLGESVLASRDYSVKELLELADPRPVLVAGGPLTFLLRVYAKAGEAGTLTAAVVDASGRNRLEERRENPPDAFFWTLPAENLPPGGYRLEISLGQHQKSWPLRVAPNP